MGKISFLGMVAGILTIRFASCLFCYLFVRNVVTNLLPNTLNSSYVDISSFLFTETS